MAGLHSGKKILAEFLRISVKLLSKRISVHSAVWPNLVVKEIP